MTLQLDLKPETERILRAAADARQLPVEAYLLSLVESALHPSVIPATNPATTPEEIRAWLKEVSQFGEKIRYRPDLTYSREELYDDHD